MASGMSQAVAQFINPITATVRFTINTNANGDIATGNDTTAGSKTMNFTYTKATATAQEIIYGSNADSSATTTSGIATTFIEYLLDGSIIPYETRRTTVQTTQQISGDPIPAPPEEQDPPEP